MYPRLHIGDLEFDAATESVRRNGESWSLGSRGSRLLAALLERRGDILTKAELMDAAWEGRAVEESNLSVQVASLRKILSKGSLGDIIVTVPRIGYRLALPDVAASAAVPLNQRPSVAVLPFINLSEDQEQAYFADGLAEEIIGVLGKVSGLSVIARNSSFAYRDRNIDVRKVGADLEVRFVLTGSVQRSGQRLRMYVELADAASGSQVWSTRFDRDLIDIFAIQDEIAREVADALRITISPRTSLAELEGRTANLEALDLALRGRAMLFAESPSPDRARSGIELMRRALALDPTQPGPYVALSIAFLTMAVNRWLPDVAAGVSEARRCADAAVRFDPDFALGYGVSSIVALMEKDGARVESDSLRGFEINPNHPLVQVARGNAFTHGGRPLEAISYFEEAIRLDPALTHQNLHNLATAYLLAARYETAASLLRARILLVPETDISRGYLCAALGHLGRPEEARQVWNDLMAINPTYSLRERLSNFWFSNRSDPERILEGAAKAGLPA
jgi:TolB-like protein